MVNKRDITIIFEPSVWNDPTKIPKDEEPTCKQGKARCKGGEGG